jgi:hypothetical protein
MLWEVTPAGRHQNTTSRANFRAWRAQNTSYENIAAFSDQRFNLTGDGEPEELSVQCDAETFQVLASIHFSANVSADDESRALVAVLSYGLATSFWRRASVIGQR